MSKRDRGLVRELGISVAQLAAALDRSRQAVNRGIAQSKDYLKPADLVTALGYWRKSNVELYRLASDRIREIYPEIAKAVVASMGGAEAIPFSPDVPGQYWLVTGDYVGFRNDLPRCAAQFEELCGQKHAEVTVFVNRRDEVPARRLEARFAKRVHVMVCETDLRLMPSTLLRMDEQDGIDMFGASEGGFISLAHSEAARLRIAVQDTLMKEDRGKTRE
jgi:hypothetical protein